MRACSVCRSCTLALIAVGHVYAILPKATTPARGPFDALKVEDQRCLEALQDWQKPETSIQSEPIISSSSPEQGKAAVAETPEPVIDLVAPASTSIPVNPPLSIVSTRQESDPDLLDFPSFAQWKERHLAHAASAAVKDLHHQTHKKRTNHSHDSRQQPAKPASDGSGGSEDHEPTADIGKARAADAIGEPGSIAEDGATHSMTPSTEYQRLLHPVPHAGTNDPVLDPLISLKDRTNYASFDCSATLIRASKKTKSASAILSSKKDRYMLTPCTASEKFVIIELCDEIQIDTVVLANLEFFSSMFKSFRVKAGTSYPESTGTWQELGTFRASNVRGLQVFRPPEPTGGGFYRYLRIDFLSHYGTEYYCPVSILRVFGHNQLEAYRRDQERDAMLVDAETKLLDDGSEADVDAVVVEAEQETVIAEFRPAVVASTKTLAHVALSHSSETGQPTEATTVHSSIAASTLPVVTRSVAELSKSTSSKVDHPMETLVDLTVEQLQAGSSPLSTNTALSVMAESYQPFPVSSSSATVNASVDRKAESTTSPSSPTSPPPRPAVSASSQTSQKHIASSSDTAPIDSHSSGVLSQPTSGVAGSSAMASGALPVPPTPVAGSNSTASNSTLTASEPTSMVSGPATKLPTSTPLASSGVPTSVVLNSSTSTRAPTIQTILPTHVRRNETRQPAPQVVYTHASNPHPNESIYGTIMKRLMALEFNTTLTTTYIEEHTRTVWSALRRVEDKILNLEKTRSQQDQLLRRLMLDLELHRARIESERAELSAQLSMLSREMVLEKRLGIAQLLALVILLFFVILTRGSPSTPFVNMVSPPNTAALAFPRSARPRPRSIFDRPEGLSRLSGDFSIPRERRQQYSDRKGINSTMLPASRTGSMKKTSRGAGLPKRATSPTNAIPLRVNSDSMPLLDAFSPAVTGSTVSPVCTMPTPFASTATSPGPAQTEPYLQRIGTETPSSAALRASPDTTRGSPVDAIKRRLKLWPPRRASVDSAAGPAQAVVSGPPTPEKRKLFSLAPRMRRRSTVASADADEEEGNSKAWLSTSDDSGEESSTRQASFSGISRSLSQPSVPFPPSPDPSDAERPHVS